MRKMITTESLKLQIKTFLSSMERKLLFPTAVSSYAPDISFGIEIRTIRVNGKKYAVGEEVIINRLPYEAPTKEDFVGPPT